MRTLITVASLIATVVALSLPVHAQLQPPEVEWEKTFGGAGNDVGFSVLQTADGGYIVAGGADFGGGADVYLYLVKTDSQGNLAV
jgi:hypothetical protein